ncbi:MAG: caspase family protein [Gemmatimonadaceae bacterium]|nr:caspase family protein [Gemmatimonadaceae bacterium]
MSHGSAVPGPWCRLTGVVTSILAMALAEAGASGQYEHLSFRQRWAILVGVGAYGPDSGFQPLERASRDVELVRQALVEGAAFEPGRIRSLVDSSATRVSLQALFARLSDEVGEEDLVFFYYSGRGTRTRDDLYPDMEPDRLDECLLLADAVRGQADTYWRDDELGRLLRRLRARYTVVAIDAGFTGDGQLDKGVTSPLEQTAESGFLDGITRTDYLPAGAAVLSAGGPAEAIREGVFTVPLAAQLREADHVVRLGEVYETLHELGRLRETARPRLQPANRLFRSLPLAGATRVIDADSLGAQVWIDDRLVNLTTPVEVFLETGTHTLRVSKGEALWKTELTVDGSNRQEPIRARLKPPPAERPWGGILLGSGAALLIAGYLGYRIRRQRQVQEDRRRSYPNWARQIEEGLLGVWNDDLDQGIDPQEGGRSVGRFHLGAIPRIHRAYAGRRYVAEHEEFDLEVNGESIALAPAPRQVLRQFDEHWRQGLDLLNVSSPAALRAFATAAGQGAGLLCRSLGFTVDEAAGRREGPFWGTVVHTTSLRGAKIPSPFPLVFLQRPVFESEDLSHLRTLMESFGLIGRFALVVVYLNELEARFTIRTQAQGLGYDFIVLGQTEIKRIAASTDLFRRRVFMRPVLQQVDLIVVSPYVTTGPVPDTIFFGREEEIKTIVQTLHTKNIGIVGGRRIGKTSVLQKVYRTFMLPASDYRPFYANYQAVTNYQAFFAHVRSNWGLQVEGPEPERFHQLITQLYKEEERTIVFLMDEMDALLRFDTHHDELLFKSFRALSEEGKCRFVFSGERILHRQLHDLASPMLNFCDALPLRYLDPPNARRIVIEPMELMDIELVDADDLVGRILGVSSCHPRIIQYLCDRLVRRIAREESRRVTPYHCQSVLDSGEFQAEFIETIWGQGDPLERTVTLVMAETPGGPGLSREGLEEGLHRAGLEVPGAALDTALSNLHMCAILEADRPPYAFTAKAFPHILHRVKNIGEAIEQVKPGTGFARDLAAAKADGLSSR